MGRYHVLNGAIQIRCRDILRQVCDANDVRILKGVVSREQCPYAFKLSL